MGYCPKAPGFEVPWGIARRLSVVCRQNGLALKTEYHFGFWLSATVADTDVIGLVEKQDPLAAVVTVEPKRARRTQPIRQHYYCCATMAASPQLAWPP